MSTECGVAQWRRSVTFYGSIKCSTHLSALALPAQILFLFNCFLIHIILQNFVNDFLFFFLGTSMLPPFAAAAAAYGL